MTVTEEERETFAFPHADIIDTRDLVDLLAELNECEDRDYEEQALLEALQTMADGIVDWPYGEALIAEHAFEDYARELAEEIGAIDRDAAWPLSYINWPRAAEALRMDYSAYDVDGVTYYAR